MADPFVVLVFIAAERAEDAAVRAIGPALRKSLANGAVVLVEERATLPTDAEARAFGANVHAEAIVEIEWDAVATERVRIHLFRSDYARWIDRSMAFSDADKPAERGRSIGLAASSTLTKTREEVAASEGPLDPEPHAAPASPLVDPSGEAPTLPSRPAPPAPPVAVTTLRAPATPPRDAPRASLALGARGGVGLGGPSFSARWYPLARVGIGATASTSFGSVPAFGARASTSDLGGGAFVPLLGGPTHRYELGVSVDLLAVERSLTEEGLAGEVTRSRWVLGARAEVSGVVFVSSTLGPTLGVSLDSAFAPIDVRRGQRVVATLPVARATLFLGVAARF